MVWQRSCQCLETCNVRKCVAPGIHSNSPSFLLRNAVLLGFRPKYVGVVCRCDVCCMLQCSIVCRSDGRVVRSAFLAAVCATIRVRVAWSRSAVVSESRRLADATPVSSEFVRVVAPSRLVARVTTQHQQKYRADEKMQKNQQALGERILCKPAYHIQVKCGVRSAQ